MVTQAKRVLVVLDREDDLHWKSLRNEPSVHIIIADQLNTYDVMVNDDVVFTEKAYAEFLAHAAKGNSK
jgi:large subunit ribosomal protein L4